MRRTWTAFGSLSCLWATLLPPAAEGQTAFPVELRVEGDQAVRAEARSFFGRELRSIPDVAVVDSLGDWELLVLAGEMRSAEGTLGIVVAATLLEIVDARDLAAAGPGTGLELGHPQDDRSLRRYRNMWVYHGGPHDMPTLARQMVAEIDVLVFEAGR